MSDLGQHIADLRKQRRYSQTEFADQVNKISGDRVRLTQAAMSRVELGLRELSVAEGLYIAKVLGTSVESLLAQTDWWDQRRLDRVRSTRTVTHSVSITPVFDCDEDTLRAALVGYALVCACGWSQTVDRHRANGAEADPWQDAHRHYKQCEKQIGEAPEK